MSFCGNSTFWNWNTSVSSSWPRLPQCFQSTVLVYLPAGFLLVSCLVYLPYLINRPTVQRTINTGLCISKTLVSMLLLTLACAALITEGFEFLPPLSSLEDEFLPLTSARYVAKAVEMMCYATTAFIGQLEKQRSVMTSGVLFVYWLLLFVCDVPPLITFIEIKMYSIDPARFALFLTTIVLIGVQLVLNSFADVQATKRRYRCEDDSPDLKASFLSRMVFFWMSSLLYTGYKRPLKMSDLWHIKQSDSCNVVLFRFHRAVFTNQRNNSSIKQSSFTMSIRQGKRIMGDIAINDSSSTSDDEKTSLLNKKVNSSEGNESIRNKKPRHQTRLIRILFKAFGREVILSYICKFVSDSLQFVSPFLLKILIDYVADEDRLEGKPRQPRTWHAYIVVTAMLMTSLLQSVFYHQHFQLAMTSGMRIKTALMAAIYKKSLRLNNSGRLACSSGEIVNLMSVDAQRIQDMTNYTWMTWSIPYQMALAVFLLWSIMGIPVLAGIGLLLLLVPINAVLAYHQQRLQQRNLLWKDRRIKLLGEVLAGIKVLKLYAWEEIFHQKIQALRQREVTVLTRLAWLSAIGTFMWMCAPYLVSLASFGTFILMSPSSVLTPQLAFITLALFNILQFPIAFIPEFVNFTSQGIVAARRIGEFLVETELNKDNDHASNRGLMDATPPNGNSAVYIDKGMFAWNLDDGFRLHGINVHIAQASLVAVVGSVGSGKTSLLSCMLGEMEQLQGVLWVKESKAYVPQSAWIQNATLQQNILFGSVMQYKRYKAVIRACALDLDLKMLSGGDQTEIGEKGTNLSGGQRQRVSIARAIYSNADVYILDDPLSAVDSEVGKQIFKRAISNKGLIRHKTRIMSTHGIQWLPLVDEIIFLQEGRIVESGSYLQLTMKDGLFTQFLRTELAKESDEELSSQDEEVRNMKKTIRQHVDSLTSCSESATSGDDTRRRRTVSGTESSQNSDGNSCPNMSQELSRRHNTHSTGQRENDTSGMSRLVEQESAEDGNIKLSVYGKYCQNIGYGYTAIILGLFTVYQVFNVIANIWLARWTGNPTLLSPNATSVQIRRMNTHYILVYGLLGAIQVFFISIYAFLIALRMVTASARMHTAMLSRVLGTPMSFMDTTPAGRILNRFSRDIENVDNELPQVLLMFIMCIFSVTSTLVVISLQAVLFASVIIPLFVLYWALQRFFVRTSRQLKRLEAVSRSPVFSHFSETLSGCQVIRAFSRTRYFENEFSRRINKNTVFYFAGISANRWLGVWIEFISSLVVLASSIFLLITPGVDGATLGLAVTYALQITQALKWLVRTLSDIETNSVSLERIHEFTMLPQEVPPTNNTIDVGKDWPDRGEVIFNHVTIRYRENTSPVLKDASFVIKPGEKIGIVGRTGAGKSSLTLALFRILDQIEGDILLDNINIKFVGLSTLRSSIAIIPQDPVLISGNVRMNIDPKEEYSDDAIWKALTLANLRPTIAAIASGLNTDVGENGSKFSMGQRQLLCLARALLKQSKVLVMDEPTSSVDPDTDSLVQHTVFRAFHGCTTITIAHRLSTIMDCTRVMVLDAGKVVEFDRPLTLFKNPNSHFASLARASGYKRNK